MIRENVIIDVIDGLEETQKEVDLRFFFSVASLRLYEQKTGRNFFKDNEKAVRTLKEYLVNIDINNVDKLTEQEQVKLAPLLVEPAINKFVFNVLPCLYAKIQDGKYLQNEETYEVNSIEVYRGLIISNMSLEWAEQQHFNYVMSILGEINRDEEDSKPRQLSNSEIYNNMI